MILHVVLFTPRADVADAERKSFGDALEHALTSIPTVRRFSVGRRIRTGAAYDRRAADFEFCAVIEFDDLAGLRDYLLHSAHVQLGQLFNTTSRDAFAGDYDAVDSAPAHALTRWHAAT